MHTTMLQHVILKVQNVTIPSSLLSDLWHWLLICSPSSCCFWLSLTKRAFCIAGRKSGTLIAELWPAAVAQSDSYSLPLLCESEDMWWGCWSANSPCQAPSTLTVLQTISIYPQHKLNRNYKEMLSTIWWDLYKSHQGGTWRGGAVHIRGLILGGSG